jgi:hypothetical protein
VIRGGEELSSYPARCVLGLERRTLPGETAADVEAELAALLDRCRAAGPGLDATQRTLLVREPFEAPDGAKILEAVRTAAAEVAGRRPPIAGASYWADTECDISTHVRRGRDRGGRHAALLRVPKAATTADGTSADAREAPAAQSEARWLCPAAPNAAHNGRLQRDDAKSRETVRAATAVCSPGEAAPQVRIE